MVNTHFSELQNSRLTLQCASVKILRYLSDIFHFADTRMIRFQIHFSIENLTVRIIKFWLFLRILHPIKGVSATQFRVYLHKYFFYELKSISGLQIMTIYRTANS